MLFGAALIYLPDVSTHYQQPTPSPGFGEQRMKTRKPVALTPERLLRHIRNEAIAQSKCTLYFHDDWWTPFVKELKAAMPYADRKEQRLIAGLVQEVLDRYPTQTLTVLWHCTEEGRADFAAHHAYLSSSPGSTRADKGLDFSPPHKWREHFINHLIPHVLCMVMEVARKETLTTKTNRP
jgi:hypothetical protein